MPECTLVVRERNMPVAKINLEESSGRIEFTYIYLNSGRVRKGTVKMIGKDSHLIWNSQEIGYLINFSYYNYTPKIRYTFKYTFKTNAEKMGKGHYEIETYMCTVEPVESLDKVLERLYVDIYGLSLRLSSDYPNQYTYRCLYNWQSHCKHGSQIFSGTGG